MPKKGSRAQKRRIRRSGASTPRGPERSPIGRRRGGTWDGFWIKYPTQTVAVVVGAVLVALAVLVFTSLRSADAPGDFSFSVYQGQDVLGGSDLRFSEVLEIGKPVVLDFWAGDCPPCRAEMPDFQRIYDAHKDELVFLGLDVGIFTGLGTRDSALALLDELNITYPAGTPPSRRAVDLYQVGGMPSTVFFTSDGTELGRWEGAISEAQMNSIIDDLLSAS